MNEKKLTKEEKIDIITKKNKKTLEIVEQMNSYYESIESLLEESYNKNNRIVKKKNVKWSIF